ncbi:uncharacterized protein LOC100368538 [Saccoglossus kowalevskii]|uniref:Uncharacterized protein LOC100368538 n=1 Tax=Saccoglossus kowalevskii TaxID=10224 RepID=A0ABM0GYF2_SACKO|nr:PREDICTED: uncharacterized protein LOC100368538 [Saccoglossus kowalevskii]
MKLCYVIFIHFGLMCACTQIKAFPNFASLFMNTGKETSGSGQDEEVLPPHAFTEEEALRALHLAPCSSGEGLACEGTDECFSSLAEVCHGDMVCGMDVFCDSQDDPISCREDYINTGCQHDKAVQWLTTNGVPNFGISTHYDLQIFFDLWLFEDTKFCTDGRIKCHDECLLYDELCDSSKTHCKCNGKNISRIISEYRMMYVFLRFRGGNAGNAFKKSSPYSRH